MLDVYNVLLRLCHRRQTSGRVELLAKPTTTTELEPRRVAIHPRVLGSHPQNVQNGRNESSILCCAGELWVVVIIIAIVESRSVGVCRHVFVLFVRRQRTTFGGMTTTMAVTMMSLVVRKRIYCPAARNRKRWLLRFLFALVNGTILLEVHHLSWTERMAQMFTQREGVR